MVQVLPPETLRDGGGRYRPFVLSGDTGGRRMIRLECWETVGGYWLIVQEVIVEPDKPSSRTRLGHVSWPDERGRKLTGMDLLAEVCEHALDLAYGRVDPRSGAIDA